MASIGGMNADRAARARQEQERSAAAKSGSSTSSGARPGSTQWVQEQRAQEALKGGSGATPSGTGSTGGNNAYVTGKDDYGNTDWSAAWDAAVSRGAGYDELAQIAKNRKTKIETNAAQNPGYNQYYNDAKQQEMEAYLGRIQPQTPTVEYQQPGQADNTALIEELNRLARESALAELRGAYEKNLAGLDRTQQAIAPTYQAARNQAAGQAELQKRQFAEYAAANGLNSGAGGQAQLAMNNALQGSLSDLSTQEASSLADLELQRSQTESDYNNAIAKARADGDYQLASQLYQEKVRVDEAMREQMMWQAQQDFQNAQFDWQKQVTQGQMDSDAAQQRFDNLMSLAKYQAEQTGDYSLFAQFGYTAEQIAALEEAWKREHMQLYNSGISGTRSGGGGSGTQKPTLTAAQAMSAIESGMVTPGVKSAFEYYYGVPYDEQFKETEGSKPRTQGDTGLATLPGPVNPAWNPQVAANGVMNAAGMVDLLPWTQSGQSLSTAGNTILNQLRTIPGLTEENKVAIIRDALSNGRISEADAQVLLTAVGY